MKETTMEERYWKRYRELATHPLANGLKDFIKHEISLAVSAKVEEIRRAIEKKLEEEKESNKGDIRVYRSIHQDKEMILSLPSLLPEDNK